VTSVSRAKARGEELLLSSLINYFYFNSGKIYKNKNCFCLTIRKFSDIENKLIPFFIKYPILPLLVAIVMVMIALSNSLCPMGFMPLGGKRETKI
jgi:hypothetical protein